MSVTTNQVDALADRSSVPTVPIWRLTLEQYQQMVGAGALTEDDSIEFLDGWLVAKMIKDPAHRVATELVSEALRRLAPEDWHAESQEPITLARSEPEPDVSILRGDQRRYRHNHPGPGDVALVVEISDARLHQDRTLKLAIYAEAAIPVYWILNLVDRRLEIYTDPSGPCDAPQYRQRREYSPSEKVTVVIAGQEAGTLTVGDLLP